MSHPSPSRLRSRLATWHDRNHDTLIDRDREQAFARYSGHCWELTAGHTLMLNDFIEPIRRFFEKRHMQAELKQLRASGELEQILRDADYTYFRGGQGDGYYYAYRKGTESDQGAYLFLSTSTDEVMWWIVQRYREETDLKTG
ncbi:MAG: hypothetical protein P8179_16395 [Candidatus Thiodiazotropha sp.]